MNTIMEQLTEADISTLNEATRILDSFLTEKGNAFTSPDAVKSYLRLKLANRSSEHFAVMFLDTSHHLLSYEELFHGSIDSCSVHPRIIIQKALMMGNCAALLLAHNHPSGCSISSEADKTITRSIVEAAKLFQIRVLDHIIIGDGESTGFAEQGLI